MGIDGELEARIGEALRTGDLRQAATTAVRGYGPAVLGYLRALLGDADGDDAFSIYCESLWKQIGGFRGESSFLTWSYRLAWGAARTVGRSPARRRERRLETSELEAIAQEVRTSTARYLRAEVASHVERLRASLSPDEQTLLILRVDRDLPWADVASVMELTEPVLRKRFERVKSKLRELSRSQPA